MCRIRGTVELHVTWGGGVELGHRGLQVPSGNKVSVCCAPSRPKRLISFLPRYRKRWRVNSAKQRKGPFNTHGCSVVISPPLLVCFFTRSACLCCPAWSASACIQMALLPLSALHCRVSLFCCFPICDLPGTRRRDKEESAIPPTVPPGEFKNSFYKVMHLDNLIALSCLNTMPWPMHLIKHVFFGFWVIHWVNMECVKFLHVLNNNGTKKKLRSKEQ